MDEVLNKSFSEIMDAVNKSKKSQQRHKKVFVDKSGTSTSLRKISDVTSTFFTNQYQNQNSGSLVSKIIGVNGSDISLNCFSDRVKSSLVFKELVKQELLPSSPPNTVAQYRQFLNMQLDTKKFVDENISYLKQPNETDQEMTQMEYQSRMCLPDALNEYLMNVSFNDKRKILKLVLDVDLRTLLNKSVPTEGKATVEQFLNNRQSTFQSQLSDEIQMDLQEYETDAITDRDKCVLTFFYNIKKALNIGQSEIYQAPDNIKQLTIGKGINRSNTFNFPHYNTLVGPERVKVAARRAMTLFSSGLAKITKGISNKLNRKAAEQFVQAGATTIFNVSNEDGTRCFQDGKNACDQFTDGKESAASAILMMYMEFMDYMINPSPPLMLRKDMKVTALYKDDEPYDEENYDKWDAEKKATFRQEYLKFVGKYMNVGFTFGSQRGSHGMLLLNLSSWGDESSEVVVNPFRVKEDSILFKYFGDFRLQPNRLGIGYYARKIWLNHKIKYDFDPVYCDAFKQKLQYYPRPVFDINFFEMGENPRFSELYCNVPHNVPNGPQKACAHRTFLDSQTMQQWIKMDPIKFQNDLVDGLPVDPIWLTTEDSKETFSRESLALWNIHENFRDSKFDEQNPFKDILLSNKPEYQVVLPKFETKEGSHFNEDTKWEILNFPKTRCFKAANGMIAPLETILSPPHLQDPLLHPIYNQHVSKTQVWSDEGRRMFAYPLASIDGKKLSQNVFPVGTRKKSLTWKPYKQRATTIYEIFPKAQDEEHEVWDLRIALICLMGSRASLQVDQAIKMIQTTKLNIESIDLQDINDLKIENRCSIPKIMFSEVSLQNVPILKYVNCEKAVSLPDVNEIYSPKKKEIKASDSEELLRLDEDLKEQGYDEEMDFKHDEENILNLKKLCALEIVSVDKKSKLKNKKNYFLVSQNSGQNYFNQKKNSIVEIDVANLEDNLSNLKDIFADGSNKVFIPVNTDKKSVLFTVEELADENVVQFIKKLASLAKCKKKTISKLFPLS